MLPPPRGPLGPPAGIRFDAGQQQSVSSSRRLRAIAGLTAGYPPSDSRFSRSRNVQAESQCLTRVGFIRTSRPMLQHRLQCLPRGRTLRIHAPVGGMVEGLRKGTRKIEPDWLRSCRDAGMHWDAAEQQKTSGQQKTPQKRGLKFRPWMLPDCTMVPKRGLEPPRFYPPVPETGASTNSATWAIRARIFAMRHRFVNEKK